MAGQVRKEELEGVLMQAMLTAKNLRPQRDRLLQLRRRMQQKRRQDGDGDAEWIHVLASDLFEVYFIGIEAGARMLATCLKLAAKGGARLALNPALAVIPDEQLYAVLLAQRFPARPTTQTEAFSLVEAVFNAVKLAQEHHIPRCIELLVGERPPNETVAPPRVSSMVGYSDNLVAAALEYIAKNGLPCPAPEAPARADAATGKKAPQAKGSIDLDQALTYLHRGCSLTSLAVKHIDLAVAVLSSFLDPEKVASLSKFTDKRAYISEDGPYPSDE
uniref:Uncharacterized protein n=1 Tax=Avena sativa TaxID=4498 RepID=A0ACD5VNG2_AVESA